MSKKIFYFFALLGAMVVFAPACGDSDPCKDVECANGTCFEGVCDCEAGYFTDANGSCTINAAGVYNVSENCTVGIYSAEVLAGATAGELKIKGFWGEFVANVNVTVSGNNLTITRQEPDGDKFFVEGSGTWSVNAGGKVVLSLSYTVKDETVPGAIQTATCSATYTQQ